MPNNTRADLEQSLEAHSRHEFLVASALAPDVFEGAVEIVPDLEIDPVTHEVLDTPLSNLLDWKYTRFTYQAKPNLIGACFLTEEGELWQVKVFGGEPDGERTGQYYAPKGSGDRLYLPPVPTRIREQIAAKYGLTSPSPDESFWEWFMRHPVIPLLVTEGAKKALAAISLGIPAVSLYGCNCGAKTVDSEGKVVPLFAIPELGELAQGRVVNIAFDRDTKPKAKSQVAKGLRTLGIALSKVASEVRVVTWEASQGKGLDDLIANCGPEAFAAALDEAVTFEDWQLKKYTDLSAQVSLKINQRYLGQDLVIPLDAQIIGINSPQGTGKTEFLAQQVDPALAKGHKVLVIGHRQQLMKELSNRFGVEYRTELSKLGRLQGYALCIDSLHPNANPSFNPEDWEEALIMIDECEQVFWHLWNSPTCQQNRIPILQAFQRLLRVAIDDGGKVYLSDADLSPIALKYVQSLLTGLVDELGDPIEVKTWVVQNEFKPNQGRKLFVYPENDPSQLLADCVGALASGQKVLMHTSAQKVRSQNGTINLESYFTQKFPQLKILRIDSETVSDPQHPAYGCMGNLNNILPNYDIVLASPTLETGVSIDVKHFDSVWVLATGVQTVDAVCQALERVRDDLPRYLWAKKVSSEGVAGGATNPHAIINSQKRLAKGQINLLTRAGYSDWPDFETDGHNHHLTGWAKRAAVVNAGFWKYRESIVNKLASEGYEMMPVTKTVAEVENAPILPGEVSQELKLIRDLNHQAECEAIALAPEISTSELKKMENKRAKTQAERRKERKAQLQRRYATDDVTPELVAQDDRGWYPQLRLHYYLSLGQPFLHDRDNDRLSRMTEKTKSVFTPDLNKSQIGFKVKALEAIGINQFLDSTQEFTSDSLQEWFNRISQPQPRSQIREILGVSINPDKESPIALANKFLKLLGLKLVCIGSETGDDGKRRRVYRGASFPNDGRLGIFTRWLERDEELYHFDPSCTRFL